jgi:hypothetical protein
MIEVSSISLMMVQSFLTYLLHVQKSKEPVSEVLLNAKKVSELDQKFHQN